MGWNDHVNFDLHDDVEDLVAEGALEEGTPAYGIAQQVIHQGYDSLSRRQRYIYDRDVLPALEELAEEREVNARCCNAPN